jgi:hypothetical protein
MIKIKTINHELVKPIKLPKIEEKNIKGYDLFPELYANIFILGKKKSGKTSVIFKILKSCCNKKTIVVIFCSTVHKDSNYIEIVKYLEKNDIQVKTYTSLFEDGINQLELLTSVLQEPEQKPEKKTEKTQYLLFNDDSSDEEYEYKPKKIAPEYIFILDDLSTELHDKAVSALLKKNRHFKTKIIISSQYYNDLAKDCRQQIDYMLMFPNIPNDKVESVYKELDLATEYDIFQQLYSISTKDKYNFLYIDVRNDSFRKNFNQKFII